MKYLSGVEISVTFAGETVHIVGLGFDPEDAAIRQGLYDTRGGRGARAREMSDQLALVEIQVKADAEAFRISELQYREGTIDIVSLLNNQQLLFNAQQSLVQTKLSRLEASLALYNALGGGWEQKASDEVYKNQLDWWPL